MTDIEQTNALFTLSVKQNLVPTMPIVVTIRGNRRVYTLLFVRVSYGLISEVVMEICQGLAYIMSRKLYILYCVIPQPIHS